MTTPHLYFAKHIHPNGRTFSLALVSTHWATESNGFAELLDEGGDLMECIDCIWHVSPGQQGPSLLTVEFLPENGQEVPSGAVLDSLMRDLCDQGLADTFALSDG